MQRTLVRIVFTLLALGLAASSMAADTLSILKTDLHADGRKIEVVRLAGGKTRFEVCGGDWCQAVIASKSRRYKSSDAWDAAFLMFYYFDANDEYRAQRANHAAFLMRPYQKKCDRQRADQRAIAACVLKVLGDQSGFRYLRVQYDVGARCESIFMTRSPYFSRAGRCMPHRE